ncbi:hypothetical protein LP416_09170 [Polaromonas sp. P2-4]|nr:hypothetical protein LP416_09170 [Polaromonas sp. P2-4]
MLTLRNRPAFSLRRILVVSLLLFALLPAALVTWLLARSSTQSVGDLANQVVSSVAIRVQAETENHLQQAHVIMNGLFPAVLTKQQTLQARKWLEQPALFEPMAFALTRQSPSVPFLYMGTVKGHFFGVEQTPRGAQVVIREVRNDQANTRQFFWPASPATARSAWPVRLRAMSPAPAPGTKPRCVRAGRIFFAGCYLAGAKAAGHHAVTAGL